MAFCIVYFIVCRKNISCFHLVRLLVGVGALANGFGMETTKRGSRFSTIGSTGTIISLSIFMHNELISIVSSASGSWGQVQGEVRLVVCLL